MMKSLIPSGRHLLGGMAPELPSLLGRAVQTRENPYHDATGKFTDAAGAVSSCGTEVSNCQSTILASAGSWEAIAYDAKGRDAMEEVTKFSLASVSSLMDAKSEIRYAEKNPTDMKAAGHLWNALLKVSDADYQLANASMAMGLKNVPDSLKDARDQLDATASQIRDTFDAVEAAAKAAEDDKKESAGNLLGGLG